MAVTSLGMWVLRKGLVLGTDAMGLTGCAKTTQALPGCPHEPLVLSAPWHWRRGVADT